VGRNGTGWRQPELSPSRWRLHGVLAKPHGLYELLARGTRPEQTIWLDLQRPQHLDPPPLIASARPARAPGSEDNAIDQNGPCV
jgi:hypothetical protein